MMITTLLDPHHIFSSFSFYLAERNMCGISLGLPISRPSPAATNKPIEFEIAVGERVSSTSFLPIKYTSLYKKR